MSNKGICIRSKTYCKICDNNQNGWCTWVDKSVDEIYLQWEKRRKAYKKENEELKQQCKDFIEMLDDMCVAYLINDGLEEILND